MDVSTATQRVGARFGFGPGHRHPGLAGWLVRGGFVARGLTYGIIGGLALALALGGGAGEATNQQGALSLIATAPLGRVALFAAAVGLLAYALWKLGQAAFGEGPEGGGGTAWTDRVANLAGGVVYLGFFLLAGHVLVGHAANATAQQHAAAAGVLGWPGGRVLVAAAGAVLIAVSAAQVREAVTAGFCREVKTSAMSRRARSTFIAFGRVGLTSRAIVFALVGWFLVRTAVDYDPSNANGIDGALRTLAGQEYGSWLLGVVAAGLVGFAVFSVAEGLYRRL